MDVEDLFKKYYIEHGLAKNSQYSDYSKEQLVIEVEYLHNSLRKVLKYLNDGGTDVDEIYAVVMDGIYESRI